MNPRLARLAPLVLFAGSPALAGQQQTEPEQAPRADEQKFAWPRDRERPVCRVDGKKYTLEDLFRHIDRLHYKGMLQFIELPAGQLYFRHPIMARWVRQYADVMTLRRVAEARGVEPADIVTAVSSELTHGFEHHLADRVEKLERQGRSTELTQERFNMLLTDYQRTNGLDLEVRGLLDLLVPAVDADDDDVLRDYYEKYPRYFGGTVTISQIVVFHRDPKTGELLTGKAREAAYSKLADIQSRIDPDGSNFEEVARLLSDDRRSAARGGLLQGVKRLDPALPAILCKTAWQLADGEISGPIETPYGLHIIKRKSWMLKRYAFFHDSLKPEIARTKRLVEQENLLFGARERYGVKLYY